MASYDFQSIEKKWQQYWQEQQPFKAEVNAKKPKFYALDMFPYPSGAGLHVGHPLGYIASDIVCRFKRTKGFNVLHPMGFDAFGLPAEQYAIQTGQHPAVTTEENIARYKEQLKNIGFSFDWSKEVQTCDPDYYKWTQWIFIQLFNSWYDYEANKAKDIEELVSAFAKDGNTQINAACDEDIAPFSAADWNAFDEAKQQEILLQYRLTYLSETTVNWCPEMGTVLSNDEVKDGFSERGGFPVVRKNMKQWSMRITAYAERLLEGLDSVNWPEPLKEMQRNWIGKSKGAEMDYAIEEHEDKITVFTTRIDTVCGVTFLVLAPELDLIKKITTDAQRKEVEDYVEVAKNKSERDRMTNVKTVSGAFTGAYAINPFNKERIPIWIADYVLAGYGTGAVMAVPGGDQRDFDFAKHFDLPILPVYDSMDVSKEADATKEGKIINKGILEGLSFQEGTDKAIAFLEENNIGSGKINYRIRDAIFARQRYWGEPVPIYFKEGIPYPVAQEDLPIVLPEIDKYLPTADGDPPLARAEGFTYTPKGSNESYPLELSTMPGWAGSSWYWYRYMDANNENAFVSSEAQAYWKDVDLYIGGTEHATGHLLYSRFWNKFLCDKGFAKEEEPFKKLVNQGMIQGRSNFVYRIKGTNKFVSLGLRDKHETSPMHVEVSLVDNDILDTEAFKAWRPDLKDAEFILEDGKYICGYEVEKMSKSKYNVVNPDDIIEKYGADTLRMYEMFLGPLEQFKPWSTHGIDGVFKFLRKFWRLFHNGEETFEVADEAPTNEEQKVIHRTIKKVEEDINNLSLNTSVSTLMIAVNELTALKCNKREVLEKLVITLSPFAPHLAEELWELLGHKGGVSLAQFPVYDERFLTESTHEYPISINGKVRAKIAFAIDKPKGEIEAEVLDNEVVKKWTEGKTPKKMIIVPKRIINVVV
ncbi:leucyl-tRNA synthetase [Reichenbachiella faecimaris]|uniref:Leucine--tRNA ligase n=1 Tax=Reichenbachiella faecimaris TaxID=692418 RepID=A0A1W2GMN6_REIFA|nr:leucine--tRNA ligase [Reichenbachiella faecimaris]SMD37861.1 leucyl-tRNA synthetase [Reichenbachiella faecimaris]